MEIYYWYYPYKEQILIKGFGKFDIRTKYGIIGDIFKFFPLVFFITWEKPNSVNVNIPVLLKNKKMDIPEVPKEWEISLLNDQHAT